jgi:Zn-dependent protease
MFRQLSLKPQSADVSAQQPLTRRLARIVLVVILGTLLGVVLALVAGGIAFAFPGHSLGYVTAPIACMVFSVMLRKMIDAALDRPAIGARASPPSVASQAGGTALGNGESDELFQEVLKHLRKATTRASSNRSGLFVLSLAAFLVLGAQLESLTSLAALVAVLLIHELGHVAAMRAFGYRDLGIFFIPLFGAIATGRKERAAAWQEAVVALMGPAPGLVAAIVGAVAIHHQPGHPFVTRVIGMAVFINGLNLLPFRPFDGGRVASIVLFSNRPRAQVVLGALTALALAVLSFYLRFWLLAALAAASMITTRYAYRTAACAERLRERAAAELSCAPADAAQAPEPLLHSILDDWRSECARAGLRTGGPKPIAGFMANIYAMAQVPVARVATRVVLGIAYLILLVPSAWVVANTLASSR